MCSGKTVIFLASEPALFETRSGLLTALPGPDGIELDFPSDPVSEPIADPGELAELQTILGAPVKFAGHNRFDLLVELETEELVRGLRPDIQRLEQFPVRGVIVTARSHSGEYDLVSRFFAPGSGSMKTRFAARRIAASGPYWAEKIGRTKLTARQLSCRGGTVKIRVEGPRTVLIGHAVTVLRGELV